ncbi:MAG TPA: tRNA glutamyl-Q(34) synthetase GluQRS [Burkholderiaceae bacterium]|nr:tRNA glutamyl-Q(34) synthetase GluQRS [Burkholderiaceae bacterium]
MTPVGGQHSDRYRGRFAPSPTGPLHAGSLATALASWLDARAADGVWLIRIEDLDAPRVVPGSARQILDTLARCGLESDEPIVLQSERTDAYRAAFTRLHEAGLLYGCACSRKDVESAIAAQAASTSIYPGTCARRPPRVKPIRAYRVRVPADELSFVDRAAGRIAQNLQRDAGDFILKRADGLWAYQLAVVVDDAAQRITDVVRGADLLDNTPRQIFLQQALRLPTPRYLHVPLVLNPTGEKLSKQSGATPVDTTNLLAELNRAALHLGLPAFGPHSIKEFMQLAVKAWRQRSTRQSA